MYQIGNKELAVLSLYISEYTRKYYVREISKLASLALKTTQRTLQSLEKARILISEIHGKNKYFRLNLSNIETKYLLVQAEIYRTRFFLEKYPVFKTFLKELDVGHFLQPLILFGSFASLSSNKNSDIDLLTIGAKGKELPAHLLPHKIHEILLKTRDFIEAIEKGETLIKKIQENHVILTQHSAVVDMIWGKYAK